MILRNIQRNQIDTMYKAVFLADKRNCSMNSSCSASGLGITCSTHARNRLHCSVVAERKSSQSGAIRIDLRRLGKAKVLKVLIQQVVGIVWNISNEIVPAVILYKHVDLGSVRTGPHHGIKSLYLCVW